MSTYSFQSLQAKTGSTGNSPLFARAKDAEDAETVGARAEDAEDAGGEGARTEDVEGAGSESPAVSVRVEDAESESPAVRD